MTRKASTLTTLLCLAELLAVLSSTHVADSAEPPAELTPWLAKSQAWVRDTEGPVVSLGDNGDFDDTHIFAPAVAWEDGVFRLWYCGSRGEVAERVFRLGMATSRDGRRFLKFAGSPVAEFADGQHSVLTPTLLRRPDGTTLREDGKLRMWFSSTWFEGESNVHSLHDMTSDDGVTWSSPSPPLAENVYAPTVIRTDRGYQMWYTDVSREPWRFRYAFSRDGKSWRVAPEPCLTIDQPWERNRLFYPTVVRSDGVYLMWYGSYWSAQPSTTALGFAVSQDGLHWYKHSQNPVFRPDPDRSWESHYVTSQSVMRLTNGSYRMWYASRKKPPFVNKYFAINTAVWQGRPSN